jgi:hypothetical protein
MARSRNVEMILRDWRNAEAQLVGHESSPDPALVERIESLKAEYAAAVKDRDVEAHSLGRAPSQPPDDEPEAGRSR